MRVVGAAEIDGLFDRIGLMEALRAAFRADIHVPLRHSHALPGDGAVLLLMPAFGDGASGLGHIVVKIVSVLPGNEQRGVDTVQAVVLLLSGETGVPLAIIDGPALTHWRTAAASALAADYLARPDASHLLMIGAGALAPHLIAAHAAVRPIERVTIWNRNPARARDLAARLARPGLEVGVAGDLAQALGEADIVSAATLASEPLVEGALLKAGAHIDLVGGFAPRMREADDDAIRRASIYIDTPAAIREAGDIVQPLAGGILAEADIAGDLAALVRGAAPGRRSPAEITLFKSVGTALEDLAAAVHLWERLGSG